MTTALRVRTVSRKKAEKAVQYGPPQPPVQDLHGTTITREHMEAFQRDPLGRDKFSKNERLRQWEHTEELHQRHRNAPLPMKDVLAQLPLPPYGIHLLAAPMGQGKSLAAAVIAKRFYERGWPVYSSASFLFGQRLSLMECYSFPDLVTPGSCIFVDEVHTFVDRYSSNSVRGRTFGQSTTALRKEQVTVLGASANSVMIGWEYKGAAEYAITPEQYFRRGKLKAPPFCHVMLKIGGPYPYQRQDKTLVERGFLKVNNQKNYYHRLDPLEVMAAAKLIDSFESVRLGENFDIDAKAMAAERNKDRAENVAGADLLGLIHRIWQMGFVKPGGSIQFSTLRTLMQQNGVQQASVPKLKAVLELEGIAFSNAAVKDDDLREYFVSKGVGQQEAFDDDD